jgi:hypothetical protein
MVMNGRGLSRSEGVWNRRRRSEALDQSHADLADHCHLYKVMHSAFIS